MAKHSRGKTFAVEIENDHSQEKFTVAASVVKHSRLGEEPRKQEKFST